MNTARQLAKTPPYERGRGAASRTAPISGVTPARSRVRQIFAGLNQAYRAASMLQKSGWQSVANTLNHQQKRTGRQRISPSNAYVTLNAARLACGMTIQHDAPTDLSAPPMLSPITVHSSGPLRRHDTDAAFLLTLTCSGYPHAVQILAAAPTPQGKTTFPDNTFKPIGSLPALSAEAPTDLAALYTAAFGTPEAGSQIALKLVATSPAGIRRVPLLLLGMVSVPIPASAPLAEAPASALDSTQSPGTRVSRGYETPGKGELIVRWTTEGGIACGLSLLACRAR